MVVGCDSHAWKSGEPAFKTPQAITLKSRVKKFFRRNRGSAYQLHEILRELELKEEIDMDIRTYDEDATHDSMSSLFSEVVRTVLRRKVSEKHAETVLDYVLQMALTEVVHQLVVEEKVEARTVRSATHYAYSGSLK
jgi:hypothetical protein